MFGNLRQDSALYVLDKKDGMNLIFAKNIKLSNPYPEFNSKYPLNNNTMLIDIEADDNTTHFKFTQIPINVSSFEKDGVFITENRDTMQIEIENILAKCEDALANTENHIKTKERCLQLLPLINPSIAKEKEQEDKINSLEQKFGDMQETLSEMNKMLKDMITKNQ